MLFSIDAHAIGQHLTGNETYVRNLLDQFDRLDRDSEFIACVSRKSALGAVPERFHTRFVADNPFVRLGWDLARQIRRDRPNLLHVQYTGPLFCSSSVVVSVHDVSFLSNPEYFPKFRARQLRTTVRRTVQKAAKVLTASEFSRRCIVEAYCLDEEKVISIPNGVSPSFRPLARQAAARLVRERFDIAGPYVLTIGDLQPRKNHLGLIRAFEEAMRARPELPHQLLITGKDTWYSPEIRGAAAKSPLSSRIHFTGFAEDRDLPALYGGCDLFIFPSFYEGFGLPILEAMACGRAVACSNTSAMPEVADSAALLFDPASIAEMTRALLDLLLDAELRGRMERLGIQRAAHFGWERTARETLNVYYEVAGRRAPLAAESGRAIMLSKASGAE